MREYIRNITKTNELVLSGAVGNDEIYQFEFGKNFVPEMSYEHRGLILIQMNILQLRNWF